MWFCLHYLVSIWYSFMFHKMKVSITITFAQCDWLASCHTADNFTDFQFSSYYLFSTCKLNYFIAHICYEILYSKNITKKIKITWISIVTRTWHDTKVVGSVLTQAAGCSTLTILFLISLFILFVTAFV